MNTDVKNGTWKCENMQFMQYIKDPRERTHIQKRYLLWPLRCVLGMLNGTDSDSNGGTFPSKFDKL